MIKASRIVLLLLCIWASPAASFLPALPALRHHRAATIEAELPKKHAFLLLKQRRNSVLGSMSGGDHDDGQLPIEKFRSLMGNLYGAAGLAHAADCFLGDSQLLVAAGSPPVQELPMAGQGLVALWCAAGPIAFAASKVGGKAADIGLLFYGAVEVAGAAILDSELANLGGAAAEIDPLTNVILVQGIVVASWLYSKNKGV